MRRLLLCLFFIAIAAASASAQSIGIFFDPGAASCSGAIQAGTTRRLYIIALLQGPNVNSITGAEFRVTGLPAGWGVISTRNPASNIQIGDPFDATGVNLAFPLCVQEFLAPLFTVDLTATSSVSNHYLTIQPRNPPANPDFACSLVVRCGPTFSLVCAGGGAAIINPTGPGCTVGVEPASWSRVKNLFKS
jgi:hypothetical protein